MKDRPIAFTLLFSFVFIASVMGGVDIAGNWAKDPAFALGNLFGMFIATWIIWFIARSLVRAVTR